MKRALFVLAAGILFVAFLGTDAARGDDEARYGFRAGETLIYEITIKMQIPERMRTETSFIALHPVSVDADGQTRLAYAWGVENGAASLSWLWADSPAANGKQLSIDPHGTILDASNALDDAQLEASQGNAWRLVLQPLPTAGQNAWSAQRPIKLIDSRRAPGPFGGMPFGGMPFGGRPFGGSPQAPSDVQATEKITYAAQPHAGSRMTVLRQYDLATAQDAGDHYEHIHGDGQYVFDIQSGRVT